MTVPMDTTISLTAGHVLAISAAKAIREDPEKAKKCAWRNRLFTLTVFVPVSMYFWVRWPDWSWMYLAGKRSRSVVLVACGCAGYLVASELGWRNATRLIKAGRIDRALLHAALSLTPLAMMMLFGWRRTRWQGTLEEFEAGTAKDVLRSPDFILSLVGAGLLGGLAGAPLAYRNIRDGLECDEDLWAIPTSW